MNAQKPDEGVSSKRRLRRFFSDQSIVAIGQTLLLSEAETRHISRTLRLCQGDACLVADGRGREAEACIETIKGNQAVIKITQLLSDTSAHLNSGFLRIFVACPKKGKLDDMIEKAQEIGVDEVVLMETSRTEVKFSSDRLEGVLERLKKIAQEAAKQSGALRLTEVKSVMKWKQVISSLCGETAILFHPHASGSSLKAWMKSFEQTNENKRPEKLSVLIGPEGGFTDQEVEDARKHHVDVLNFGKNVLKVDTAFVTTAFALKLFLRED